MSKKTTDRVTKALNIGSGFVSAMSAVLAAVLILYSGYVLYDSMAIEVSAFSSNSDLLKYKPSVLGQETKASPSLSEINEDYRAWITVHGDNPASPIDYPIMQGPDDLYYAAHDIYDNTSLTGAIYLAAGNREDFSDSYNLLYGHHMDNGAMFGSLDRFKDKDYFDAHRTATVVTKNGTIFDITFFATVTTDAYENRIYTVGNQAAEVIDFLDECSQSSSGSGTGIGTKLLVYYDKVARSASKIIALSTCASADTNGRLVVFGKMVRRGNTMPTATPTATGSGGGSSGPTPSPTPQSIEPVKLTVKYYEGGRQAFPDEVLIYTPGDSYYVVSPQYPGYDADIEIVRGTIEEDMIVTVRYVPKTWVLTIRYILPDGSEAAPTYNRPIKTGEGYDVASPTVAGYKPVFLRKAGVNPGRDEKHTVLYMPEDQELEDLPTPLSLGWTVMQIGICTE